MEYGESDCDDWKSNRNEYDYSRLDTFYELDKKEYDGLESIIVWNKYTENYSLSSMEKIVDELNYKEFRIESMENHLKEVLKELYCKDRKLEELGVSIECCDENVETEE